MNVIIFIPEFILNVKIVTSKTNTILIIYNNK